MSWSYHQLYLLFLLITHVENRIALWRCARDCFSFWTKWLINKLYEQIHSNQMKTHNALFIFVQTVQKKPTRRGCDTRHDCRQNIVYVYMWWRCCLHWCIKYSKHSRIHKQKPYKYTYIYKIFAFITRYSGATIHPTKLLFLCEILVWAKCLQYLLQDVSYNHILDNSSWNNNAK